MPRTAGVRMSDLSGYMVDQHRALVDRATTTLTAASRTDSALQGYVRQAAAATQAGATQLDAIADNVRRISMSASSAKSPPLNAPS